MADTEAPRGQVYFVPATRIDKDVDGKETKTTLMIPIGAEFPRQYFPPEGDYTRSNTYINRRVMFEEGTIYKNRDEAMQAHPELFSDKPAPVEAPAPVERLSLPERIKEANDRFKRSAIRNRPQMDKSADEEKKPDAEAIALDDKSN